MKHEGARGTSATKSILTRAALRERRKLERQRKAEGRRQRRRMTR